MDFQVNQESKDLQVLSDFVVVILLYKSVEDANWWCSSQVYQDIKVLLVIKEIEVISVHRDWDILDLQV